jgi:prepilin-type N-terminal cleavage/methylation domain-containing protein
LQHGLERGTMRRAFSIAELMIVVAIIGILAALVVPYVGNHAAEAKEAAAKDNLRILRDAIKFYAVRHGDTFPGYAGDDRATVPTADRFYQQLIVEENFLRRVPENPFNELDTVHVILNDQAFPAEATGACGWIYQPATGNIRVDWPGADSQGVRYIDY